MNCNNIHVGRVRKRLNIESKLNPINDPTSNIYDPPFISGTDYYKYRRRKFPDYCGNNYNAPDYFKVSGLPDTRISYEYRDKHVHQKKGLELPAAGKSNENIRRGIKCFSDGCNRESKPFTENLGTKSVSIGRGYDIISTLDEPNIEVPTGSRKYFSYLANLNVFINNWDKNDGALKRKSNRLNDGIYDYLKTNQYV